MTPNAEEFIRRFFLHVLPKGFMKIIYFGFLSNVKKRYVFSKTENFSTTLLTCRNRSKKLFRRLCNG
jgi:hypothetical protein